MTPVSAHDGRPRVLTLTLDAGSGWGGAEKLAYEFARRLDAQRFKSYLCTIRAPLASRRESTARDLVQLAAADIPVLALDQPGPFLMAPTAWWRLYALLARERIDIVHAHMPRASVPGAILARLAQVPVIVSHEHGSALDGKLARRLLDRQVVARLSTTMLAVSEWDRRNLIEREGIAPERIAVLPNGIVSPPSDAPDVRPELDIGPGTRLIGAVGRLAPEKGYDDLIRAMALLKGQGRQITCVILGDGPDERRLQALIEELGVVAEVRLLGRRPDAWRVIAALEVAVLSSRREGSPLAVLEYMAGAAPIVATAVGGVPELIGDGVHGLLVAPGDPAALAAGIARLLDDRGLAARLGDAARARQAAEFDLAVLVGRLEDLYVELLARSTVTRRHRRRI